jgi:S1-C subfamily serine protease
MQGSLARRAMNGGFVLKMRMVLAVSLVVLGGGAPLRAEMMVERSVVRLINTTQHPSWFSPWAGGPVQRVTGSGFVIEGGWIVTNAHVVSDSRFLALFFNGDPNPHEGKVVVEGHDCDLALVRPVEPDLLKNVPALPIGDLPRLRSTVVTYGYPSGGDQITSTSGVVSRIDRQTYVHSMADGHLTVQTDAAINPGASGGAVIQDGKVVGVSFQNNKQLQSVGFFIPTEVVRHFLADAKGGTYRGYPDLAIRVATLENEAARRRAGMQADESGVRVDWIAPGGSAEGILRVGDTLLRVDGESIANDGSIKSGELRLPFGLLVDRHQIGDDLSLRILRDGQHLDQTIPLKGFPLNLRWSNRYDLRPRYYIYAGLVFVPLDREMVKTFGDNWLSEANAELVYDLLIRPQGEPDFLRKERVVLLRRLDDAVNANLPFSKSIIVDRVNDKPIGSLEDLIEAFEGNHGTYHVLEFAYFGRTEVIDREAADKANARILRDYAVPEDRHQ